MERELSVTAAGAMFHANTVGVVQARLWLGAAQLALVFAASAAVFAVDHGFLVCGTLFAIALWRGQLVLRAFAGSGLLQAVADFLTPNEDARRKSATRAKDKNEQLKARMSLNAPTAKDQPSQR